MDNDREHRNIDREEMSISRPGTHEKSASKMDPHPEKKVLASDGDGTMGNRQALRFRRQNSTPQRGGFLPGCLCPAFHGIIPFVPDGTSLKRRIAKGGRLCGFIAVNSVI